MGSEASIDTPCTPCRQGAVGDPDLLKPELSPTVGIVVVVIHPSITGQSRVESIVVGQRLDTDSMPVAENVLDSAVVIVQPSHVVTQRESSLPQAVALHHEVVPVHAASACRGMINTRIDASKVATTREIRILCCNHLF